jgi:hypothetical protein
MRHKLYSGVPSKLTRYPHDNVYGRIYSTQSGVLEKWVKSGERSEKLKVGGEKIGAMRRRKKVSVRAAACEVFKFINEVRLVVIAAGDGHICPRVR